MKTAKELWQYVSKTGLKPLPKTSVSQWADDYRMLSQGLSAEPGRWKTSRAPYQKDIMDAFTQPGINRVVVKSASQVGKALDVETPIMTTTGWKRMGDLTINDQVFDENGNPVRILAVSEVWNDRPCYEVKFSDGEVIIADENHDWYVDVDTDGTFIFETKSIYKLIAWLNSKVWIHETFSRRIVSVTPVANRATVCIEVDSPTHLFLAGRNLVPTHNSDIMNNVLGRYAHLDPCAVMMIQPTIELAQDYSKSRISPMIRDTKVLSQVFYETKSEDGAKTRDGKNTILSKLFPGGRLIMCGANSPAGLASRPVRVLLADEVDRFPDSAGTEGDPVDLAAKRMTTFWNRVMGLFSTPTNEGSSRIDVEYQTGTQEEWQHECPNCGEYHLIRHTEMECETEEHKDAKGRKIVVVSDVKWRCPDCGSTFSEDEMRKVPQKYMSKNPAALHNGIRSFFVNGFTSPWLTWNDIMREWLEAKGDPTREKVVMNTRFGESYAQQGAFEDYQQFIRRREKYGADLPDGVLLLTGAVDTQDNRLEYEITGWGYGEECWGICKGVILGQPDNKATWDALDAVLDKVYRFKNGTGLKVARAFIDSGGHYTSKVYEYCEKNFSKQRFAIKGTAGTPGIPLNYKIGKASGSKIPLVMLGVDDGKQQVMNRLAIDEPGAKYFHFPLDEEFLGTRGYDELYFKGIISEHKKKVKRKGVIHEIWEPTAGVRNEPLDLRVYNLACMNSIHPDWDRLAEVVKGGGHSTTTVTNTRKKPMRKRVRRASKVADI
ncbi:MAG: terminase gpA endonuclease subunit [Veillonella sp.]|uniref:terminase gpA endonuclease subunit n=1 Tax=Veillonella sp. TaxID=1926307 RepID=UPI00290C5D27|nr:terminase gpA endonuclease subunit [Veillonella sp.]MDU5735414.1 terminase gpA endonuclease subunit [Veillonella sp.]MDU5834717.1 terminase gpA endonuclease subunit [Veillonella sp.]